MYPKWHFLSILETTDHGIRPRLFSTDNEVYCSYSPRMISPLSIDLGQFIFGWHFRNFLGYERPFSLDIEGYRSRIRPETILQR
ncbi:unnamed protein product [Linum trigynum]|uniref:Uncharacterized protein n=1 Tax=Linum trigynum TaxID=586398 RepID=A0AAV2FMB4_9ROSI